MQHLSGSGIQTYLLALKELSYKIENHVQKKSILILLVLISYIKYSSLSVCQFFPPCPHHDSVYTTSIF